MTNTITINMDKKCVECGKGGAAGSGICLACTNKALKGKPMRSGLGQLVQQRMRELRNQRPSQGSGE